jgi:hypothetical protein
MRTKCGSTQGLRTGTAGGMRRPTSEHPTGCQGGSVTDNPTAFTEVVIRLRPTATTSSGFADPLGALAEIARARFDLPHGHRLGGRVQTVRFVHNVGRSRSPKAWAGLPSRPFSPGVARRDRLSGSSGDASGQPGGQAPQARNVYQRPHRHCGPPVVRSPAAPQDIHAESTKAPSR